MTHPTQIIARCTRDGRTAWQAVANMLGVSRETAMRLYGPMPSVIEIEPENIGPIDKLPQAEMRRSPHIRTSGRKTMIIVDLLRRPQSARELADLHGANLESTRVSLSELKADGVVESSGPMPYTWTLTVFGREVWRRESATETAA